LLASLDGRPRQNDAIDLTVYEALDGFGHGQISLAGSGGAGSKNEIVAVHGTNVLALRPRAG
jgi:hypothetical protein